MDTPNKVKYKSIGGAIPEELYWRFKAAQSARHEGATKALEIAIQLYCDAIPCDGGVTKGDGANGSL